MRKVWMVMVMLGSSTASADKLADFKEADRYDHGCQTIPVTYSSERSGCEREAPNVHPLCDGTSSYPVSCGNARDTPDAKGRIEKAKRDIEELEDKKSRAESNRSNAVSDEEKRKISDEIEALDRLIYEKRKELDAAERALEERRRLIELALYNIDKCIATRTAVGYNFLHALDMMRNESETAEIKDVAYSLASKYKAQRDGHEEQLREVKLNYQNCKDWRP